MQSLGKGSLEKWETNQPESGLLDTVEGVCFQGGMARKQLRILLYFPSRARPFEVASARLVSIGFHRIVASA